MGGCGGVSGHWGRLWSRLQDGVLRAREAEAQRRPWRGRTTGTQAAVIPKYFFSLLPAFEPGSKKPLHGGIFTLGYLNLKNHDLFKTPANADGDGDLCFTSHCL